jgi:hypothetical protein
VAITDKREEIANQLLMRGHATMMELLTVSFGEWPPKGLDINPEIKHGQVVKLIPMGGQAAMALATMPTRKQELWIKLNKELTQQYGGALYSTMGHEMVHLLQGDHSTRLHKGFLGKIKEFFVGEEGLVSENIVEEFTSRKGNAFLSSGLSSAFKRIDGKRTMSHQDELMFRMSMLILSRGSEIQARIHQIVMDGYPRWGKVPADRDEFFAAMKNSGFQLPPEIEKQLEALPADSGARGFLSCESPTSKTCVQKVAEIHKIINALPEKSRDAFWKEAMPALYSDLIEMYGDKPGRGRFGLGENPKNKIPLKYFPGQNTP